jgi:hypothetical protein
VNEVKDGLPPTLHPSVKVSAKSEGEYSVE